MNQFTAFIYKELLHILRDKRTLLILFGMPVVMMLLFGFAISTDVRRVRTVVVTSQLDYLTHQRIEALNASEYFSVTHRVSTPAQAEQLIRSQRADMAVVFAPRYASRGGVQLLTDGADPNMAQLYTAYASQILSPGNASVSTRLLYNPQVRSCCNFVPGIMGMLLMLICALMTSSSIVREKERGTMEVLLASPVRPLLVLVAKAVPYLILSFVMLISILLISRFALDVPIRGSLFWIFAVSCLYILVALSLGLLISTVARTQLVALLCSAMVLMLPSILLSGMMFPVESMPKVLQYVSAVLPPRYYIAAIRKLMIMGTSIDKAANEVGVLLIMLTVLLSAALLNFKKRLQ